MKKHGPVTINDIEVIGGYNIRSDIEGAIKALSGKTGWAEFGYYLDVMERLGLPKGVSTSDVKVAAFERARLILIEQPKNRREFEKLLTEALLQ